MGTTRKVYPQCLAFLRPCVSQGSLHILFCMTLLTVILLIEKWTERSSDLSRAERGAGSRSHLFLGAGEKFKDGVCRSS